MTDQSSGKAHLDTDERQRPPNEVSEAERQSIRGACAALEKMLKDVLACPDPRLHFTEEEKMRHQNRVTRLTRDMCMLAKSDFPLTRVEYAMMLNLLQFEQMNLVELRYREEKYEERMMRLSDNEIDQAMERWRRISGLEKKTGDNSPEER